MNVSIFSLKVDEQFILAGKKYKVVKFKKKFMPTLGRQLNVVCIDLKTGKEISELPQEVLEARVKRSTQIYF